MPGPDEQQVGDGHSRLVCGYEQSDFWTITS